MVSALLSGRLRRRVGNPTQNEAPDRELIEFLSSSLAWISSYLKTSFMTQESIPLVAAQPSYALPKNFLMMNWVAVNNNILQPTSTWAINSGAVTTATAGPSGNWLTAAPSLPVRYAIEGRELILNPPPDTNTVANTPTMTWRYLACATTWAQQSEIGIGRQGVPSLSELDEDLLIYDAAIAWCAAHPSQDNQQRIQNYQAEISRRLPEAKRRWSEQIQDYLATHRPDTSGRLSPAR